MTLRQYGDYPVAVAELTGAAGTLNSVWQAGPPAEHWHGPLVLGFGATEHEAVADYFRAWLARYQAMPPSVKDKVTR